MANASDSLQKLHSDINACKICSAFPGYLKPSPLERGGKASIMVVGQGPGKTEERSGKAFSGQAGERLMKWLVACGAEPNDPRADVYLTSVVKCRSDRRAFKGMSKKCQPFLLRQIQLVEPKLIISLGADAYRALTVYNDLPYDDALFQLQETWTAPVLFPPLGVHYRLIPWPHPSGLNRKLNDTKVMSELERSFGVVKAMWAK